MSAPSSCSGSMRTSGSSSAFVSTSTARDPILLARRASSESSATLPCSSSSVAEAFSKATLLSPSSSAQSSLSFATSISSTSYSSASSLPPTVAIPVIAPQDNIAENIRMIRHDDDRDREDDIDVDVDAEESIPPSFKKTETTAPPRTQHIINSIGARPALTPRSTSSFSDQSNPPPPPLFFGDYLFPENPSLQDLHQVFRLDKSSKQKDFRQSLQLHAHLMGLMLSARVSRGLDLAYDHAHDAFKNKQRPDRRNEFVSTFNYTYDEAERILAHSLAHPQPRPSFLDMMSPSSSAAILTFLHRIRTDHSILATAFRNLQSQELDALLVHERPAIGLSSQSHLRGTRDRGYSSQTGTGGYATQQSPTHQSQAQQRQQQQYQHSQGTVPNFVNNQDVVHIILANLFGPASFEREHILRTRSVTKIFVALLSERKGERLMTEMLERYVVQSEWQQASRLKARFEETLSDIIRRGELDLAGFSDEELSANIMPSTNQLLHQHHHQYLHQSLGRMSSVPTMKTPVTDLSASQHVQHGTGPRESAHTGASDVRIHSQQEMTGRQALVEGFFTEACLDLLDTLQEFSPPCLMELSRLIFMEIDQSARPYASLIIIVKFFFYRFMNKCIAYPETYGMMQDTFVSEKQRQRILFTTHQRLYRYVTSILNPVPGWESRSWVVDTRIRERIDSFVKLFSTPAQTGESQPTQYILNPIAELSNPAPVSANLDRHLTSGSNMPTVTPVLLLCPSDFTTLFYFVCPNFRTTTSSSSSSAALMTRSSSFNGKSNIGIRQRTPSETQPAYPAALKLASNNAASASGAPTTPKHFHPSSAIRSRRRASPSFSFFSSAAASLPFKAKPPPPLALEKTTSAPAETTFGGSSFLTLSGIKPGQAASPRTATVEVTSTSGIAAASSPCTLPLGGEDQNTPVKSATSTSAQVFHRSADSTPVVRHWSDEALIPDLKAAVLELKKIQPGSVKEVPWAVNNTSLTPLREPWALAFVQYGDGDGDVEGQKDFISSEQDTSPDNKKDGAKGVLIEAGLALAPSCMAMIMENSAMGGGSRIVTVTKPMLVDQVMDSADNQANFDSNIDLDLDVDGSDSESLLSSEDSSLAQKPLTLGVEDKDISILRVNSNRILSSVDDSGTKMLSATGEQAGPKTDSDHSRPRLDSSKSSIWKKAAAGRAWKTRIRQTVSSEADLPEEVKTVARSIFKILREFDVLAVDDSEERHWDHHDEEYSSHVSHRSIRTLLLQGIEQARYFGNHAAAIGFHHALRVLESSSVLRQLDSSKIIYLLAMPIKHRLEHRTGRARSRTIWEGFAHSWHLRLVSAIERKREALSSLRVKMYYQTCVRTSSSFEKSLGVISVLGRLNRNALRKYLTADEWERCNGFFPSWNGAESKPGVERNASCHHVGCKGSCLDHPSQIVCEGEVAGHTDKTSRRYSANNYNPHALRTSRTRRSSFSTYIDSMTSRSFGSSSFLESSLGHLKEREQATFSTSYGSGYQGMLWPGNSGSQAGSIGSLGEVADIQSDFSMDAREAEAAQRWITDAGIHNFLPGEDNFLRFCMEVESVVRGIGLGGTGIQGAGIPQAQNGVILPALSSSGSDFFIKEVTKFNGQFVLGMGPMDQVVQVKSSGASGVAEFLVNSLKNGHAASSVPNTSGSHFFSHATSSANSVHSVLNSSSSSGSSQTSQMSMNSLGTSSLGGRSRILHRQASSYQANHEAIPTLLDDPSSIYASPPGPTYALYNPPFSTASHGASSSYSGFMGLGGTSSTLSSHQISMLPKDMAEFLRRIQLKLTSFILSEWVDIFGEVETDRWFREFLDEMGSRETERKPDAFEDTQATVDTNQDGYMLPLNQMDMGGKSQGELKPCSTTSLANTIAPGNTLESRSSTAADSDSPDSSSNSRNRHVASHPEWTEAQFKQRQHDLDLDSVVPPDVPTAVKSSASVTTFSTAKSLKNAPTFNSMININATTDGQYGMGGHNPLSRPGLLRDSTCPVFSQQSSINTADECTTSGKSLLNVQVKHHLKETGSRGIKRPGNPVASYDLAEAYRLTVEQFNNAKSPYQKLGHLFALELLIVASLSYPDSCLDGLMARPSKFDPYEGGNPSGSARSKPSGNIDQEEINVDTPRALTPGTDAIVDEIENLFRQPGVLRPRHLLRDMQLIAAFIPGSILDLRDDGKAFWDMSLAISSLKSEVVEYIVQKGIRLVEVEEAARTSQETESNGGRSIAQDDDERTRMTEAVRLFTIGAKESHAVAQRELAILYMSLPTLPSSSSPSIGFFKADSSPLITQINRVPSPISITTSKLGRMPGRTHTPPPLASPKSTFSSSFLGKSSTASIPIKQRPRHHHSSSGSGSSFGSGMLSGLGIMTGLGSFTGSSSIGSGGSAEGLNSSSMASLAHQQQQPLGEFAEGHHDVDQYLDVHTGRHSVPAHTHQSNHLYQHQRQHQQHSYQTSAHHAMPPNSSEPDKFNPENVAAAMHWFTLAAAQGDKFSINYLKHKETAGGILGGMG
ncbi:hypothetical protein BC939DRAFT_503778 [Gamsiella multidivaricata]|uniref:uncharacterized protein n=1 Tax=Gamsiella multidivaricata TaxID=101098 RepID=UPI00221EFDDE|nr:uncharacterized protein BC939DRAFT_503778 [Gamsiella multidivaricata]KAG0371240.1 hypothetical protein BGZ54_008244 [Gamsiella multidivaricata]KAI7822555.1 hypothetical protein BC939DRAFT_503778 [Gamsiella multidivaricata]